MDDSVDMADERRRSTLRKVVVAVLLATGTPAAILLFFTLASPEASSAPTPELGSLYMTLAYIHLGTIAPCLPLAVWLLLRQKGTPVHKLLGKIYMVLISFSAVVAAAMPSMTVPRLWNHFGFIHVFCVAVFVSVPYALWAIRHGNVRGHAWAMRGLFLGGVVIAGAFTLLPGRLLHAWLFL